MPAARLLALYTAMRLIASARVVYHTLMPARRGSVVRVTYRCSCYGAAEGDIPGMYSDDMAGEQAKGIRRVCCALAYSYFVTAQAMRHVVMPLERARLSAAVEAWRAVDMPTTPRARRRELRRSLIDDDASRYYARCYTRERGPAGLRHMPFTRRALQPLTDLRHAAGFSAIRQRAAIPRPAIDTRKASLQRVTPSQL